MAALDRTRLIGLLPLDPNRTTPSRLEADPDILHRPLEGREHRNHFEELRELDDPLNRRHTHDQ